MAVNAQVSKNDNETAINLIRRFSKRVQGAGLIQEMRGRRYHARIKSREVQKKHTLKVIKRREHIMEQIKLGKMPEQRPRKGGRR